MKQPLLPVLNPDLQIAFHYKLKSINDQYLHQALSDTVKRLKIPDIDKQLAEYVNHESIKKVASYGLRGELFFPVPCIMESNPKLLGYYRLLYGISQKEFYNKGPFGAFKRLEEQGIITQKIKPLIEPSPTTTRFFNIDHIQDPSHEEYQLFRDLLSSLLSIQIQQIDN